MRIADSAVVNHNRPVVTDRRLIKRLQINTLKMTLDLKRFVIDGRFSPRAYMRETRPHLFSDSAVQTDDVLDKNQFEYFLDTLTSRNQENEFEDFCRRLAQHEICPNLRPMTGPTGGGDSKTDSSTVPVAPDLGFRSYFGTPQLAVNENWAFAFSAKKAWKPKAKSDVAKIANRDRRFSKAYFITNQFVRDKERSKLEESLSSEHKIEVHILDRNWIVDRVVQGRLLWIAKESLGFATGTQESRQQGPIDTARNDELANIQSQLAAPFEYYSNDYQLASDYRRAALLARGLERPRHEVDGLFRRACDLAKAFGNTKQIVWCSYDYAWTLMWWFEDVEAVWNVLREMECHLPSLGDCEDLELIGNLLTILSGAAKSGDIDASSDALAIAYEHWASRLLELSRDKSRPNNAAYAQSQLLLMKLHATNMLQGATVTEENKVAFPERVLLGPNESFEFICSKTLECLRSAKRMPMFPLVPFANHILEYGNFITDAIADFDRLCEEATRVLGERGGERSEGEALLSRGLQLASHGRHRDALITLSKARHKLSKEESSYDTCQASLALSDCYISMNLYWAARTEALLAALLSIRMTDEGLRDPFLGLLAARRLCWCEAALGRVAPFLAWYEWCWLLLDQLDPASYAVDKLRRVVSELELLLCGRLLQLPTDEAAELAELADGLAKRGLGVASVVIRHVSGDSNAVVEVARDIGLSVEEVTSGFGNLQTQTTEAFGEIALNGQTRSIWKMSTSIFNVDFAIRSENKYDTVLFAENLLSVFEAVLATARWECLAFVIEDITFEIQQSNVGKCPPALKSPMDSDQFDATHKVVFCPALLKWMGECRDEFAEWFYQFVIGAIFIATIDPVEDVMKELNRLGEEGTFDRAFSTSPTSVVVDDLIGRDKYEISYWY